MMQFHNTWTEDLPALVERQEQRNGKFFVDLWVGIHDKSQEISKALAGQEQ